jgi:predicted dehydrogenase
VWRVDPSQAGVGGTLGDCGSHALNLLEYISGDTVVELCADKSTFLPDRVLDEDVNVLLRLKGGGKGTLTVSQIAIGEENALRIKVFGSKGAIVWDQENPNYMSVYKFGEPRQTYTRASGYLAKAALEINRVPTGHPEGYLEAFANIYCDAAEAIRRYLDGDPMKTEEYKFPTVYDGLRGMQFISKAVESSEKGSSWISM